MLANIRRDGLGNRQPRALGNLPTVTPGRPIDRPLGPHKRIKLLCQPIHYCPWGILQVCAQGCPGLQSGKGADSTLWVSNRAAGSCSSGPWAGTPAEMALPPLRCDGSVDLARLRQWEWHTGFLAQVRATMGDWGPQWGQRFQYPSSTQGACGGAYLALWFI